MKEIVCPICGRAFLPGTVCAGCLWDDSVDCEGYPTLYDASGAASGAVRGEQSRRRAGESERNGLYLELGRIVFGAFSPKELRGCIEADRPAEAVCRLLSSPGPGTVQPASAGQWRNNILRSGFRNDPGIDRSGVEAIRFQDTLRGVPGDAPDLSEAGDGSVRALLREENGAKTLVICADGGVCAPESCESLFEGFGSLRSLDFGSCFHTEGSTNMQRMFSGCASLRDLDLQSFDTSRVESMYGMFSGCASLQGLDVSGFDTSRTETMFAMFYGCASLRSLDLRSFDTSRVTSMFAMFRSCASLQTLDLRSFDTSQVRDMSLMFSGCAALRGPDTRHFVIRKDCNTDGMYPSTGPTARRGR